MPDFERRRKRRFALRCQHCGHRIVWTKFDPDHHSEGDPFIAGHPLLPWRWQGKDTPIVYFHEQGIEFVAVICKSCGPTVHPADAIPSLVTF